MEKSLKNIKAEFKANGIYYTPPELVETLKNYVDFEPKSIYDPTVGQGNLLTVFPDDIPKYGQDIYADELEKASERLKNFHGYCGDTLTDDGFPDMKFDLIIANPPFSIKWTPNAYDIRWKDAPCIPTKGKADYAFLLHILYHLSDNGKAICLQFPGVLHRGQKEGKIRQWMIEQNFIERVVSIPAKTFVDTAIATCVIVFNKNKTTTDIIFEDKETGEEYTATFDEVKKANFILSVNHYKPAKVFELCDEDFYETASKYLLWKFGFRDDILRVSDVIARQAIALETNSRENALKTIENEIKYSKTVSELEGWSIIPFLDEIDAITAKYRKEDSELNIEGTIRN